MTLFDNHHLFKTRIALISALFFVGMLFVVRGLAMNKPVLPLILTQKIRNLSNFETDWQIATTAQPNDTLEYFILISLPTTDERKTFNNFSLQAIFDNNFIYQDKTFSSVALGINDASANDLAQKFFSNQGLTIKQIKNNEFIDIKWQEKLSGNIKITDNKFKILKNHSTIKAKKFQNRVAESIIGINFDSSKKSNQKKSDINFYGPRIIGINIQKNSNSLVIGAMVIGYDLNAIKTIKLKPSNKNLTWRLISNELIKIELPDLKDNNEYYIEFFDTKNNLLKHKLSF